MGLVVANNALPMMTVLNSPQWRRIHHSVLPEHRDKNFASILPLWDILFGAAWIPKPDEHPATGFDPPVRVSVIEGIIWPFRDLRLRAFGLRRSIAQEQVGTIGGKSLG